MNIKDKIAAFDPNGPGDVGGTIYGLPFSEVEARLVILPVPWEVTVSYQAGTAQAPEAVFEASFQVDLYDPFVADAWKLGIYMQEANKEIKLKSEQLRVEAEKYIDALAENDSVTEDAEYSEILRQINSEGALLNHWVKNESLRLLNENKIVALLGGDHSTPLGLIMALAEKYSSFGILHIDAHADLREAYEGFEFSHASIMYNAIKIPAVSHLVQVGIRDYCEAELNLIKNDQRITTFFDRDLRHKQYEGVSWQEQCNQIIEKLPQDVYLSFDIDGLDPKLCPNTGTPVAGGFELEQTVYLIEKVVKSGRRIIGFDLNEVAPGNDEWDANVAARLLYKLANMCITSNA